MRPRPARPVLIAVLLAIPAVSFTAAAQDFPNPKPTEAHKILEKEVGTWDATVKLFLAGPGEPPTEYKGVETVELLSGGLHLRSTFKGKFGDRDFEGHGLMGFDSKTKEYVSHWVDNFTEVPTTGKGGYNAEEKSLTLSMTTTGPNGEEMKMRQVLTWTADKAKKFEQYLQIPGGEFKLMEMVSKKRK